MENTEGWEIETWNVYMLKGALLVTSFYLFSDDHNKNNPVLYFGLLWRWWVRNAKLGPKRLIKNVPLNLVQIELPCCHSSRVQ